MENGVNTLSLAIDSSRATQGARRFESGGRKVEASARRMDRSLDRTDRKMKKLGRTSMSTSGMMARVLGGAVAIASGRAAIRVFANYEQSIATIRGVLGGQIKDQDILNESMKKISGTARELGATTRFSASQAADGLLELTRAGFTTAESTSAIAATLNLAQTAAIELGDASNITAGLVRGFGIDAADTGRVVDVLVAQSSRAKTVVQDLGVAIQKFGPIARAMGIEIEEAAAAAGVLVDAGTPAETAGINMRQVLLKLIKPTGEAKQAIEDMGLSLAEVNPEANSLADIFEKLAAGGLDATKAATIFMARNTSSALILAENVEKMRRFEEANKNASGEAAAFAAIMDDTLIGAFKSLLSATQELILQWGEREGGFGGALRDILDLSTSAVRILAGMEKTVTENRKAAFLLAAALKGIGIGLTVIVGLKIVTLTSSLLLALTGIPGVLASISAAMVPLAATMAAIAVAATSFEFGRYFFDEFKSIQVTMAKIIRFFDQSWSKVKLGWKLLMADLIDLFTTDFGNRLLTEMQNIVQVGADIINIAMPGFSAKFKTASDTLITVFGVTSSLTGKMRQTAIAEAADDLNRANLVFGNSIDAIDHKFGDKARQGNNIADFIKGDLATAEAEILAFIDGLAAKAEASFTGAISGDNAGKMGPFLPEGIAAQREAMADLQVLLSLMGDETDSLADSTSNSSEKFEEWVKELEETRTAMLIEIALLEGMTDAERILIEAKQRGLNLTREQLDLLARMEEEIIVLDTQKEKAQELKDLYDEIGDAVAGSFQDVVFGAKSAEDAIESMVRNITQLIFEMMVTQQIAGLISSSLSSAFGGGGGNSSGGDTSGLGNWRPESKGGLHYGGLNPAANGMLMSPTRLRSGGRGILGGEGGPEAIVPLARDAKGRLGIRDSGGGGGGSTVNVSMTVVTRDKASFESRESQRQIERRLRRTLSNSQESPG